MSTSRGYAGSKAGSQHGRTQPHLRIRRVDDAPDGINAVRPTRRTRHHEPLQHQHQ